MRMKVFIAAVAAFTLVSVVLAHATVRTDVGLTETKAGAFETYRLQVPVEKDVATTEVHLFIPDGLTVSTFQPVPGWTRALKKVGDRITEVTWKGRLEPNEFQRFLFTARNPAEAGKLVFKVWQTNADGTVVKWDGSDASAPASVVEVK